MKKIMLIDSDVAHLRKLSDALSKEFNVLICSRGDKAWELFSLFKPDALLLDPLADGLHASIFLDQVRRKYPKNSIPIISLIRMATLKPIENSFTFGAGFAFVKPCQGETVRKKLLDLLSKGETRVELALV